MKAKLLVLSCALALTACDKLGQQALDSIPNPSPAQEQVAQQAYQAFTQGDFPQLYTYFEPELQRELKLMKKTCANLQNRFLNKPLRLKKLYRNTLKNRQKSQVCTQLPMSMLIAIKT